MTRYALAIALVLAGCAQIPFTQPQPTPPADEGTWAVVRDRATRGGKLYDGLGANAFVRAVYLASDVREARVARLGLWTAMTAEERARLLGAEEEEAAQYDDFVLSLFTPAPADNDLDAPRSIWRVALVVPGEGEALPVRVFQMKADSTLRALYPSIGDFDVVYRVRFARWQPALGGRPFTLRFGGARGLLDLNY